MDQINKIAARSRAINATPSSVKTPTATDVMVGQRVKTARIMAKMSQENLAEALGVTFQQVQKYEKGANRIGASRMLQIAQAVQQPISYFFGDGVDATPQRDLIIEFLGAPHAVDLAELYLKMPTEQRNALVRVAGAMTPAKAA